MQPELNSSWDHRSGRPVISYDDTTHQWRRHQKNDIVNQKPGDRLPSSDDAIPRGGNGYLEDEDEECFSCQGNPGKGDADEQKKDLMMTNHCIWFRFSDDEVEKCNDEHTLLTRSTENDLFHVHVHHVHVHIHRVHVHVQNGFSIIGVLGQVSQSDLGTMKANSFEVFYTSKFEVKL